MSTARSTGTRKAAGPAPKPEPAKPAARSAKTAKMPKVATPAGAQGDAAAPKHKHKLVRDSFTIPKSEYTILDGLKQRAITLAQPARKSEILRAGIGALNAMNDKAFLAALGAIPSLKTGRPPSAKTESKDAPL